MEQLNVLVTEGETVIGEMIRYALISSAPAGKPPKVVVVNKILNMPTEESSWLEGMLRTNDSQKSERGQVDLNERFDIAILDMNIGVPSPADLVKWLSLHTLIVALSSSGAKIDALFNAVEEVVKETGVPRKYFALRHKHLLGAFLHRTPRIETEGIKAFRWPQEWDDSQRLANLEYFYQLLRISSSSGSS